MSVRARTTAEDERIVERILADLQRNGSISSLHKWHALRWALAISLRMPVDLGIPLDNSEGARSGAEYRLDQLTGDGKAKDDLTPAVRAMLSVLHRQDLYGGEKADAWLKTLLQHHLSRGLGEIKAQWRDGERFAGLLLRLLGPPGSADATREPPQPPDRLRAALEEIGIAAEVLQEVVHGPRLSRYFVKLKRIADLDRITKGLDKVAFALDQPPGALTLHHGQGTRTVGIDIPRPPQDWTRYTGADLQSWANEEPTGAVLPLCPGVDVLGNPHWLDLGAPGRAHLLLAGATGSGKSVALHAILCSLMLRKSAEELQFVLIDPKQVELGAYKTLPNLWAPPEEPPPSGPDPRVDRLLAGVPRGRVLTRGQEIQEALDALIVEMERRFTAFQDLEARDLPEARGKHAATDPWIIVVVEELADLVMHAPAAQDSLIRIAQKGRAAGLHLIVATQRPDAATFRGLLRSNLDTRLALAVQKASESRIILDEEGAERLLKPGDLLLKTAGVPLLRLHGVYMSQDDVAQVVRRVRKSTP